jgi:hypothetical protein
MSIEDSSDQGTDGPERSLANESDLVDEAQNRAISDDPVETVGLAGVGAEGGDGKKSLVSRPVKVPLATALAILLISGVLGAAMMYSLRPAKIGKESVEVSTRLKGAVVDTFSIPTGKEGLTLTANGRPWAGNTSSFKVESGQLSAASESSSPTARVALVDTGAVHHIVSATFSKVRVGSGVVFRYKGPNNYWSLTAAPGAGTWTLTKVINGEKVNPVLLGTAPVADGTQVMVRAEGNRLFFYFDGTQFNTLNDGDLSDGSRVGLIFAGSDATEVRVDDFAALPTRQLGKKLPTTPEAPNAAGPATTKAP